MTVMNSQHLAWFAPPSQRNWRYMSLHKSWAEKMCVESHTQRRVMAPHQKYIRDWVGRDHVSDTSPTPPLIFKGGG